jgi:hypothetical protein
MLSMLIRSRLLSTNRNSCTERVSHYFQMYSPSPTNSTTRRKTNVDCATCDRFFSENSPPIRPPCFSLSLPPFWLLKFCFLAFRGKIVPLWSHSCELRRAWPSPLYLQPTPILSYFVHERGQWHKVRSFFFSLLDFPSPSPPQSKNLNKTTRTLLFTFCTHLEYFRLWEFS